MDLVGLQLRDNAVEAMLHSVGQVEAGLARDLLAVGNHLPHIL